MDLPVSGLSNLWSSYYLILISGLVALFLPVIGRFINIILILNQRLPVEEEENKTKKKVEVAQSLAECRINSRFFLGLSVSSLFITIGIVLIPVVVILKQALRSDVGLLENYPVLALFSIVGFLLLAVLYSSRKGDLDWLRTYTKASKKERTQ